MSELEGKTVVVTGASKGIGAEIAAAIGAAGAHVIAHYGRDREGAERATGALPADRRKLIAADFNDPANTDPFFAEALAWRGNVDVLVNNAAIMRLAGDAALATAMGRAGRSRVEAEFTQGRMVERTIALYRELCDRETASSVDSGVAP